MNPIDLALSHSIKDFVFLGEAGSGKSELALNVAVFLSGKGEETCFFDLDMTKPLFRSRENISVLEDHHIRLYCEEQFMDAPTQVGGLRAMLTDIGKHCVLDVGGDYIGARSVGCYAPLLNRAQTGIFYIINPYRPWSDTIEHIDRVLGEVLGVSHVDLKQVHLVANPNFGPDTKAEDVLSGEKILLKMLQPYKPVDYLCVEEKLVKELRGRTVLPVFPLKLYMTYPWNSRMADTEERLK